MLLAPALAMMAVAAEPPCVAVHLPVGEASEDWEAPLELAGLCQVWDGGSAAVALVDEGGRCALEASASGKAREVVVRCPRTPDDREDLAWLAASLVRDPPPLHVDPSPPRPPAAPPAAPPRAPPPPRASAPPPLAAVDTAAPEPPPPAPETPPAAPETPPEAATAPPAEVAPPGPPPPPTVMPAPEPARPHLYAEAGIGAEIRPGTDPAVGLHIAAGVAGPRARIALALGANTPHTLPVQGGDRLFQSVEGVGIAAYRRGVLLAGLGIGASVRRYWDERASHSGVVPVGRLELRATALAAGAFRIEPTLRGQIDLRSTTIRVNGEPVYELSPWGVQLLVAVVYPP